MEQRIVKFKQTEIGQIPEDWEVLELGDLIDIKHGYAFSGKFFSVFETENVLLTPGNFNIGGGFNDAKIKYYSGDIQHDYILNTDDLVITMTDLSKAGDTLGYSALVPVSTDKKYLHNQRIGLIKIKSKKARKDFLYWLMRNQDYRNCVLGSATGTTVKHTAPERIKSYVFALPSLQEQQKIAEVLGALDDKIELNRKMNKTLESLGQTIFKRWFSDSDNKYIDSIKLGEKITILKGKNITKKTITEGDVPVVAGGLNPSCYHDTPNTTAPVITISASGANAGFIRLYQENVWASDCSYIDKSVTPYVYFYYLFLLENKEAISGLQRGSAQPHVYPKDLMELKITDFDEKLVQKFEKIVIPIFDFISNNKQQIEILSQIRDSLLPRLMSGKLRVR